MHTYVGNRMTEVIYPCSMVNHSIAPFKASRFILNRYLHLHWLEALNPSFWIQHLLMQSEIRKNAWEHEFKTLYKKGANSCTKHHTLSASPQKADQEFRFSLLLTQSIKIFSMKLVGSNLQNRIFHSLSSFRLERWPHHFF